MPLPRSATLLATVLLVLTAGCVQLVPHRNDPVRVSLKESFDKPAKAPCSIPRSIDGQPSSGAVDKTNCGRRIREDSENYSLYFAEYDDQGWAYHDDLEKEPGRVFSKDLHQLLKDKPDEGVSVVVFVHGWKHNAAVDDPNVQAFRVLLSQLNTVEQQSACGRQGVKRRVIGLYVGWRGRASNLGFLENATFWNRKEAAQRVALGDVRMLFSDLREIQEKVNVQWNEAVANVSAPVREGKAPSPLAPCSKQSFKRMKLSIAGHSFGGLIVYTSMAQSLVRDIVALKHDELSQADAKPDKRAQPLLQRQGDLIVVINPAIEATRLHPLYRAVQEAKLPHYHTPIFVSITSKTDTATRRAFPVGRWFSTFWDRYPEQHEQQERQANLYTFGHADDFVTHDLSVTKRDKLPPQNHCVPWNLEESFDKRLNHESDNLSDFRKQLAAAGNDASRMLSRYFCGIEPMQLTARDSIKTWVGNSPVWNISADAAIIDDHNDFMNAQLLELLRQLYTEADERILTGQAATQ